MFAYGYNNFDISYRMAFIVQYEGDGATAGSVPQGMSACLAGDTAAVLGQGDLVREGYVFAGWSLVPDGMQLVGTSVRVGEGDVVLYAVWEPIHFLDGGSIPSIGDRTGAVLALLGVVVVSSALCFALKRRHKCLS